MGTFQHSKITSYHVYHIDIYQISFTIAIKYFVLSTAFNICLCRAGLNAKSLNWIKQSMNN